MGNLAVTITNVSHEAEEAAMESRHGQDEELRRILYDEAFKLSNDHDEAEALTEEVFLDFITCHVVKR